MKRYILSLILLCTAAINVAARPDRLVEVLISPTSGSWECAAGDSVYFTITVLDSNLPADGIIGYEISQDLMPPLLTGSATLTDGRAVVGPATMAEPGYLRCKARYGSYSGMGTIAVSAADIQPATECPADFDSFWETTLAEARSVDLRPNLELLPELCTADINVYRASWASGNSRFYGMLAVPRSDKPLPAVVQYPGAGVYRITPNMELARKGVITLAFNPHGIAPDLDDAIYSDLAANALRDYPTINIKERDRYYYRRMIQGAVRAVDFLQTLDQCDGRIATFGGSQGGYLSVVVSALHPAVVFTEVRFPALSDMAGYLHGRAGGWPHALKSPEMQTPEVINALSYYDTVNFARRLTAPVSFAYGYNDLTCAPTTTRAVYNVITAPKQLNTAPLMGHATTSEQYNAQVDAMLQALELVDQ